MEPLGKAGVHLTIGSEVTCLFGDGRLRNAAMSVVSSEAPLYLDCVAADVLRFSFPRRVILVFQAEEQLLRGEAEVMSAEELANGKTRLQLSKVTWEDVDRRKYPRVQADIPVSLRAVYESKGETIISVVDGRTEDISVGGSRVWVHHPVIAGSLVEFAGHLSEFDTIRALGVVVHSETKGCIGIAFLDYMGAARAKLEDLVQKAAA